MKRWSSEEDEVLGEFAMYGAERVRRELKAKCGTAHSVDGVRMRASRLGISLQRYRVCPECRREVTRLVSVTGLCRECTFKRTRERQRRIEMNDRDIHSERVENIRREANATRKRNRGW